MKSGAAAIIIKDKKIFLIKRSENEGVFPGFWAGPGGRSEEGETPEQTVIREANEETGLDFEPIEIIKKDHLW